MVRRKKRIPISDIEYTGLSDTAEGFSGSTTFDRNVMAGSPLQLAGISSDSTVDQISTFHVADFCNGQNPHEALNLSGVSDPPFLSAGNSTPNPNAVPVGQSSFNAFGMLAKFGSGFATLMGNHPETISAEQGGNPAGAVMPQHVTATGTQTIIVVAVVGALFFLLLKSRLME
jgi:hypothetical protein